MMWVIRNVYYYTCKLPEHGFLKWRTRNHTVPSHNVSLSHSLFKRSNVQVVCCTRCMHPPAGGGPCASRTRSKGGHICHGVGCQFLVFTWGRPCGIWGLGGAGLCIRSVVYPIHIQFSRDKERKHCIPYCLGEIEPGGARSSRSVA